mgnify:CR=1 FL=1
MTVQKLGALAIILMIAGSFSQTLFAENSGYYRWKDEAGNLKLSDRPPANGIKAEFIPSTSLTKSPISQSTVPTPEQKATTTQSSVEMEVLPEKDPAICQQAKSNLEVLNGKTRIRIVGDDGNKRFISDEERNLQKERARQSIDIHCN